jgi:putative copper export protein
MENIIIIFIHLMAAGIGVGSLVYCILLLQPAMDKLPQQKTAEEHSFAYKSLEVLSPTVFVCLLVLVGTGIYHLMANYTRQVELAEGYYNLFGVKMIFVIAALFLSIYQTFTLKAKIANLDLAPENREQVPAILNKMRLISRLTLVSLSIAILLGVWLARF